MAFFAVVQKSRPSQGRDQDQTYVNVVTDVRERAGTFAELSALAPWNDPTASDFAIEITQQEHTDLRGDLFHDGLPNLPKWQQQNTGTGTTKAFGNFADPTNIGSTFTVDTGLADDRWIVRIGDGDPATPANHIATLDLDEDQNSGGQTGGRYLLNLRLYTNQDVQSGTNVQNAKTLIGGKNFIFDFTSGLTDFLVDTTRAGTVQFPSNHRYRVVGPNGEKSVIITIFGRVLRVED